MNTRARGQHSPDNEDENRYQQRIKVENLAVAERMYIPELPVLSPAISFIAAIADVHENRCIHYFS